jgi:hypothetical protein
LTDMLTAGWVKLIFAARAVALIRNYLTAQ